MPPHRSALAHTPTQRHQQTALLIIDLITRSLVVAGSTSILVLAAGIQRRNGLTFIKAYVLASLLLVLTVCIFLYNLLQLSAPKRCAPLRRWSLASGLCRPESALRSSVAPIPLLPPPLSPDPKPAIAVPPWGSTTALYIALVDVIGCILALLGLFFMLLTDQHLLSSSSSTAPAPTFAPTSFPTTLAGRTTLQDAEVWEAGAWQVRIYVLFGLIA
ncbi:hypothetical protein BROUX41_000966 [Berkeleyomyces rouxiae]